MNHVSTLRLHQFRLGELPPDAAALVQTHLADCDLCAARIGHQRAARAAFQREPVPAALLPSPSWRERIRGWWMGAALVPVLAGAAAITLVVSDPGVSTPVDGPAAPVPVERLATKGARTALEAWVQTGSTARPVYTGERVKAGTRIQLKYDPGGHRFVTLAGRDGAGAVEVYGTVSARGPGLANAPFALTLDNAVGEQAFFAVLTDTRPDPGWVTKLVAVNPSSTRDAEVASVVLLKE